MSGSVPWLTGSGNSWLKQGGSQFGGKTSVWIIQWGVWKVPPSGGKTARRVGGRQGSVMLQAPVFVFKCTVAVVVLTVNCGERQLAPVWMFVARSVVPAVPLKVMMVTELLNGASVTLWPDPFGEMTKASYMETPV